MRRITIILTSFLFFSVASFAQIKLDKNNIEEVISQMTLAEKATLCVGGNSAISFEGGIPTGATASTDEVPGAAGRTRAIPRLGIPATAVADGPAGLRISAATTGYPVGVLLASSWDVDLVRKVTSAMGNERR